MAAVGLIVLVPLLLLLVAGSVTAVALALSARPDGTLPSEVAAARRHAVVSSALAGAVALVVCVLLPLTLVMLRLGVPARLVACLPLVAAGSALVVLLVGELTWPRQRGATRTARLQDRSFVSVLGGRWPRWAAVVVLGQIAATVALGVLADPSGRSLTRATPGRSSTAGPFPGWDYGTVQLAALACCVGVALLVARAATHRSAVVTADPDTDLLLRRASVARAARVLVAGTLVTLGADLFVGGSAAANVWAAGGAATVLTRAAMLLGALVALAGLASLLVPVPRLSSTRSAPPPTTAVSA